MSERIQAGQIFQPVFDALSSESAAQLRVDELAERMGITPAALTKRFSRKMGISLKAFLTRETLQKCQHLLLYTGASATTIANSLDFHDVHYFHRFFKAHTGMSPLQYRRKYTHAAP